MYAERPIILRATPSMKMEIANGSIRIVIDTTTLACLFHESGYCNHRLAPDSRDQTAGLAAWFARIQFRVPPCPFNPGSCFVGPRRKDQPICLESPRSRSKKRLSRRRFLTGLFIFEKGSRKRRRRGSPNTLITKDIHIHGEDHSGTRIALLRPVCLPSRS